MIGVESCVDTRFKTAASAGNFPLVEVVEVEVEFNLSSQK